MSLRFLNGYRHGLATRPLMEFRESVTVSDEFPRFRRALTRRFGIDSRALAALRVAVGVLLLADLTLRTRGLVGFYTDSGVLPRSLLGEQYPIFAKLSLHALSGAAWFELILFAVAGVAALAGVVGPPLRPGYSASACGGASSLSMSTVSSSNSSFWSATSRSSRMSCL